MHTENIYFVDLKRKSLDVSFAPRAEVEDSLGVSSAADFESFDLKAFETEDAADAYLAKYSAALEGLDNKKICKSRKLPAMLYKRRYIVQSLLGEKLHTIRTYKKKWKSGQLFNLMDQTFFLTVRLTSISEIGAGKYRYDFELA